MKTASFKPFHPLYGLTLLVTVSLLTGCVAKSDADAANEPEPVYHHRVTAVTVAAQDSYRIPRRFTGTVTARQSVDLGFELGGKVTAVHVDEGAEVKQGEVLAELDTALLQRGRDELRAQIKETEAQLDLVRQNLRRIDDLNKKGFASVREQDELNSQRKALNATLERLAAGLAANQTRLDKAQLLAPFDAVVSRRYIDDGAVVAAGAPVLKLLQSGPLEARVGVPPRLLGALDVGDAVTLSAGGREIIGRVLALSPDVDPATRTVTVRTALTATAGLVDGDLIDLRLPETVERGGFWVPMTALTDGLRGLWNVYVLTPGEEDGRFQLQARDVQIEYADAERAFVTGALADGERIVGAGLHRLAPGQTVRLDSAFAGP